MRRLTLIGAAAFVATLASCAAPQLDQGPGVQVVSSDCVDADTITDQFVGSGSALTVRAGAKLDYEVEFGGPNCTAHSWSALWATFASSSSQICRGQVMSSMHTNGANSDLEPTQCVIRRVQQVSSAR